MILKTFSPVGTCISCYLLSYLGVFENKASPPDMEIHLTLFVPIEVEVQEKNSLFLEVSVSLMLNSLLRTRSLPGFFLVLFLWVFFGDERAPPFGSVVWKRGGQGGIRIPLIPDCSPWACFLAERMHLPGPAPYISKQSPCSRLTGSCVTGARTAAGNCQDGHPSPSAPARHGPDWCSNSSGSSR